jgi:hypothetical protein
VLTSFEMNSSSFYIIIISLLALHNHSKAASRVLELVLDIPVDCRVLPVQALYAPLYGRQDQLLPLVGLPLTSNTFHNILLLYSKMLECISFRLVKEKDTLLAIIINIYTLVHKYDKYRIFYIAVPYKVLTT